MAHVMTRTYDISDPSGRRFAHVWLTQWLAVPGGPGYWGEVL